MYGLDDHQYCTHSGQCRLFYSFPIARLEGQNPQIFAAASAILRLKASDGEQQSTGHSRELGAKQPRHERNPLLGCSAAVLTIPDLSQIFNSFFRPPTSSSPLRERFLCTKHLEILAYVFIPAGGPLSEFVPYFIQIVDPYALILRLSSETVFISTIQLSSRAHTFMIRYRRVGLHLD